jgi:hypothetical protein
MEDIAALLKDIKERVRTAQVRAALAVNRELLIDWPGHSRLAIGRRLGNEGH